MSSNSSSPIIFQSAEKQINNAYQIIVKLLNYWIPKHNNNNKNNDNDDSSNNNSNSNS